MIFSCSRVFQTAQTITFADEPTYFEIRPASKTTTQTTPMEIAMNTSGPNIELSFHLAGNCLAGVASNIVNVSRTGATQPFTNS